MNIHVQVLGPRLPPLWVSAKQGLLGRARAGLAPQESGTGFLSAGTARVPAGSARGSWGSPGQREAGSRPSLAVLTGEQVSSDYSMRERQRGHGATSGAETHTDLGVGVS